MIKTAIICLIATSGIILQTQFEIHGWIFYVLFTAYLLLVKNNADILKLVYTFLLGLLLSVGIWQLTGYLLVPFHTLKIAMPIAAFVGIFLVLLLKRNRYFNMSPAFFFGLIAYYGLALPPSVNSIVQIIIPAGAGILFGFLAAAAEKSTLLQTKNKTNNHE